MIEYKTGSDLIRVASASNENTISLTWLWEIIVRTKRLPDDLDPKLIFFVLRDRLRNPEKEVRQNALRVLADLIPILDQDTLDNYMKLLMNELIVNLAYTAPSVRKGTVDVLKIYLKTTPNPNEIIRKLITATPEDNQLKLGLIVAIPSLITPQINDETLKFVLQQLFLCTNQFLQETSVNSLAKIRRNIGQDKFQQLIGSESYEYFQKLCQDNNIAIPDNNVILETEITLETGPAITMKIHEEIPDSEEELKIIEDSDQEVSRSPRKVHFGGEIVKMRTPESDNQISDNDQVHRMEINQSTNIKITVDENVAFKSQHKSLIPVRISTKSGSQPVTPTKKLEIKRLNKSAPDLRSHQSRIPLRHTKKNKEQKTVKFKQDGTFSPIPTHKEVEIFHNLTRSPARSPTSFDLNPQDFANTQGKIEKKDEGVQVNSYPSFQVCQENRSSYPSFEVYGEKINLEKNITPLPKILQHLIGEKEIWNKYQHLDTLISILHQQPNSIQLPQIFDTLLLLEHHPRINNKVQKALILAIDLANPEEITAEIIRNLVEHGEVKAALKLMQKTSPRYILDNLPEPNEEVLQILIAASRTFPSSEIDVVQGIELATRALQDNRRRVRQAALEALASLAQLSNNTIVLETVTKLTKCEQLLRIVRTRLSRKQLPTVDPDGNVRYSSPKEKEELDWVCGGSVSGTNFWKRNSRRQEMSNDDDKIQIWAQEPKIEKDNLCPVVLPNTERGHRRFDRGRSNSPPERSSKSEKFHKSFSSEQIYQNKIEASMSSRSSTTSTGSSTKSGMWLKTAIPVPDKIRIKRHFSDNFKGPFVVQEVNRTKLESAQGTPILTRFSPQQVTTIQPLPPPSSGSESSGYFTPPAEHHLKDQPVKRPPSEKCLQREASFLVQNYHETEVSTTPVQYHVMDSDEPIQEASPIVSDERGEEKNFKNDKTSSPSDSFDVTDYPQSFTGQKSKSRSEGNLKSFLPDMFERKNVYSAPPLNDIVNIVPYKIPEIPQSTPLQTSLLPGSCNDRPSTPQKVLVDSASPRRLSKRTTCNKTKIPAKKASNKALKSDTVRPYSRPKEILFQALSQMESCDWETTMQGLTTLERLSRYHSETLEPQMHQICVALAKNIKNLRSQVARKACNVASEMFSTCKKSLEMELEDLAGPLLQRTADTNKFLRSDANAALDSMSHNLSITKVVAVISNRGSTHQNGVVRAASTRLLGELATRLGPERIFQLPKETRDKFLLVGANGLTEGSLETRRHAKALLAILATHHQFQRALMEAVPHHTMRHIAKTINSLKP